MVVGGRTDDANVAIAVNLVLHHLQVGLSLDVIWKWAS